MRMITGTVAGRIMIGEDIIGEETWEYDVKKIGTNQRTHIWAPVRGLYYAVVGVVAGFVGEWLVWWRII